MSKITDYDPKLEALKIILDARRHEIDLVWERGLFSGALWRWQQQELGTR